MRITMAIDAILERLGREDPWVRVRFADTLIGYGAKATWPLTAYIRVNLGYDENRGVIEAIRVLGTIGDREVGPALAGVLRVAADPEVRLAAIEALGFVGGPMAIPPLENALRSSDWRLRAKAATALGHIGDPTVNRALAKKLTDDDWWVRRNSAAALASLPGGDRLLFDAIRSADPLTRDAAAEALADIGALTAARERDEAGLASEEDLLLLEHVTAGDSVLV
jgi:HEAT repeat protein